MAMCYASVKVVLIANCRNFIILRGEKVVRCEIPAHRIALSLAAIKLVFG